MKKKKKKEKKILKNHLLSEFGNFALLPILSFSIFKDANEEDHVYTLSE